MNRPELDTADEHLRHELRRMPTPPPPPNLLARLHADIPEELPRVALPILQEKPLLADGQVHNERAVPLLSGSASDNVIAGPWFRNRTLWAAASIVLTLSAGLWMWRLAERGELQTLPQASVPAAQEAAPAAQEAARLPMASSGRSESAETSEPMRGSPPAGIPGANDLLDTTRSSEKDQEPVQLADEDEAELSSLGYLANAELANAELANAEPASEESASEQLSGEQLASESPDAGQVAQILAPLPAPPAPAPPPTVMAPSAKVVELEEVRAGVLEVAETSPEDRRATPGSPVRLEEPDTAKRERSSASDRDVRRRLDEGFASEPSATSEATLEAEREPAPRRPTSRIQGDYGMRATRPPLLGIRAALDAGTWPVEAWLKDLVATVCAGVRRPARIELEGITWDLVDLLRAGRQGTATLEQVDALDARLGAWIEQYEPSEPRSTVAQVCSWLPKIRKLIEATPTSP